ncbi:RhoGAP-domain-containing protein [Dentipellis sp. KUC8613]|nr:RhoGAP-domain-containing protein [Dentipellis sp. KUC8613]
MQGAFVRALGTVFHLQCFKCLDCGTVVASKFFPIDGPDGKQQPLCERDYFRRLNLICAKCGQALRGSYITACNKKFHVEHFTCAICPTVFGPQDSYYEHEGDVYCHFHYSTRFATKCAGCNTAILKQFVEINRNMRDECWHPECYMINKFWNVKINNRRPTSPSGSSPDLSQPPYAEEERRETPVSLKEKQFRMEQQVYRIWTVLSAFEESSAACISDMLRQVSNGQYLDAIRMAEKFILHVEVLFATIDDLEHYFARAHLKGMSHVREARMLCRKTVDLFTLLSHTQETGARRMGMTKELLALVTGLAHYLKILIRIALTGALKLERDYDIREAMSSFLDKLHLLAVQGGDPSARRIMKGAKGEMIVDHRSNNAGTRGVTYGFRSLAPENAGESPFNLAPRDPGLSNVPVVNPPSDLCVKCNQTVEEDCVRLGTYQRWHSHCIQCKTCGKAAAAPVPQEPPRSTEEQDRARGDDGTPPKITTLRRPPANVDLFVFELETVKDTSSFGAVPTVVYCTEHAHPGCRSGFQAVSRLEQYAFLLNVALRRLYLLLKKRKVIQLVPGGPPPPPLTQEQELEQDLYRNSGDIMRMKTAQHLDRKLSATARVAKRSTVVESPTGKVAHSSDVFSSQPRHHAEAGSSHHHGQRAHVHNAQQQPSTSGRSPRPPPQQQSSQRELRPHIEVDPQGQALRPSFNRQMTDVRIVDDSAPTSPTVGPSDDRDPMGSHDGITLADIPQLAEVAQAIEQHRSLPRQNHIPYIAELTPLELAIVKHAAVLILYRSSLREQFELDELLEMVEVKKQGFWGKLFKGAGNDKNKVKKKAGVFGVPLELLVEREGADSLHGATHCPLRVPSFIDDVVSAMRQMDMSVEGIFRKNGNIRRLKDLTEALDRDPSSVDLTHDNPVQLAALMKKFLRELPDPLLTFKLHKLLIASQTLPNDAERKRLLHMLSLILPKSHRDTMEVLFVFLKWVASFAHMDEQTGSKMDLPNLATVICPSILYSQGRDAVRDDSFGAIRVVTVLLENQDEFYAVPEEFMSMLRDQEYFSGSLELPGKDFMKKCETYLRLKANGRTPGPAPMMSPVGGSSPFQSNNGNLAQFGRPNEMEARLGPNLSRSPERPPMAPSAQSENIMRNGFHSRNQSPTPPQPMLAHSPVSYPAPGAIPASLSQGVAMIQSPQARPVNGQMPDRDWANSQRPVQQQSQPLPGSRPSSASFTRPSGDGVLINPHPPNPPTMSNGHGPIGHAS